MALPPQDVSQLGIFRTKPLQDSDTGLFVWPWIKFFQTLERLRQNAPQYFFAPHATRVKLNPQNVGIGTIFYETDRKLSYIASDSAWVYEAGIMQTTSDGIPQDLGVNDSGVLIEVMDYNHKLQWNGTGWQWGPGETGGGFTMSFSSAPKPITGWHAADGSTVDQLQPDGGIKPVTVPSVAGAYFRL